MKKIYRYAYPSSKDRFLNDIPESISYYEDQFIVEKKGQSLWVGVERTGHSGGIWYIAEAEEAGGKTIISGKFVADPDENGVSQRKTKIGDVLFWILLFPLFLIRCFGIFLFSVYKKFAKKRFKTMTNEERLDHVMVDHLHCSKIENETAF